jgi:hypothetical protein
LLANNFKFDNPNLAIKFRVIIEELIKEDQSLKLMMLYSLRQEIDRNIERMTKEEMHGKTEEVEMAEEIIEEKEEPVACEEVP